MSVHNFSLQWLFNHMVMLTWGDGPYKLKVWDSSTQSWFTISGTGGGTPLLAPGLDVEPVVELLVLAGDPPDALTMGGDFLYLRQWTPTFLGTADGDIVVA